MPFLQQSRWALGFLPELWFHAWKCQGLSTWTFYVGLLCSSHRSVTLMFYFLLFCSLKYVLVLALDPCPKRPHLSWVLFLRMSGDTWWSGGSGVVVGSMIIYVLVTCWQFFEFDFRFISFMVSFILLLFGSVTCVSVFMTLVSLSPLNCLTLT